MTIVRSLPCDQPFHESSATVHCLATNRAAYLRHAGGVLPARPVSPAIHSRTRRFFLTPAHRECQLQKTGRGCLLDNRGAGCPAPGDPSRSPLEGLAAFRTSRSGGCLSAPALGDFCSRSALRDPPLPRRSTRRDHHGTPYS